MITVSGHQPKQTGERIAVSGAPMHRDSKHRAERVSAGSVLA
jgi:hypothetical protein